MKTHCFLYDTHMNSRVCHTENKSNYEFDKRRLGLAIFHDLENLVSRKIYYHILEENNESLKT